MPGQDEHHPGGEMETSYREPESIEEMTCRATSKESENKNKEKDLEAPMPDHSGGQGTMNRNFEAWTPQDNLVSSSPPPTPAENSRLWQGAEGQVKACEGGGHDDKKVSSKEIKGVQEKTPILESFPLQTLQEVREVEQGAEGLTQDEIHGDVHDGG